VAINIAKHSYLPLRGQCRGSFILTKRTDFPFHLFKFSIEDKKNLLPKQVPAI
jgi:hypothetical protein